MARLYLQNILFPGEKVLHHAKVHYVLYVPGIFAVLMALLLMYYTPLFAAFLQLSLEMQDTIFNVTKFVSSVVFASGIAMLLRAWITIYSTELLITDKRVLVKVGVTETTTAELDRSRISSVTITKPFLGQFLNYGWISILGFSGHISGLPVLSNPHAIQKFLYQDIPNPTVTATL